MFDIDKYLDDLRIKEFSPSDSLVNKTKVSCEKILAPQKTKNTQKSKTTKFSKAAIIAIPAVAMLLIGVFLGAFLFAPKADPSVVAFYTVDINPSICINVDEKEIVKSIDSRNDDAKELLKTLDCVGLSSTQAIELVIDAAQNAGYLNDKSQYVLVGRFGDGNEQALINLQEKLEADLDGMIQLLIVSGSYEDKINADDLNVSAGLLKLSQMAQGVEVTDDTKVKDVVEEVSEYNQDKYTAPAIKASADKSGIMLSWNELDFKSMGYVGKVDYRIMAAGSETDLKDMNAVKIALLSFLSTDIQPTSYFISADTAKIDLTKMSYFAIYAVYSDDIYVSSNFVSAELVKPSPSPSPLPSKTTAPSATPEPAEEALVSGRVSGEYVKLSWQKNERAGFAGYKIVASKTNEHPSYPDDGYLKYITDENTTSKSLYEGYGGLKANTYYYFSVTYLYNDGSKVIGNAVRLNVPEKADDPTPTSTQSPTSTPQPTTAPSDYQSTNISGSISGSTVSLNWGKIDNPALEGYKVMYSFSDSTPVYEESSCYYKYWITDANTTSCTLDITSLKNYEAGKTCYFSITALYESHSIKKPGSVVSFEGPVAAPYPSTNISVSLSGTNVSTSWSQITDERLEGYKVVASFTDSSPSYPENSYAQWITDKTVTSYTIPESYIKGLDGYAPGATCYFAITAVYSSSKETGSVASLVYPN